MCVTVCVSYLPGHTCGELQQDLASNVRLWPSLAKHVPARMVAKQRCWWQVRRVRQTTRQVCVTVLAYHSWTGVSEMWASGTSVRPRKSLEEKVSLSNSSTRANLMRREKGKSNV